MEALNFQPIGVIRTKMRLKFDAPSQPKNSCEEENIVELHAGLGFENSLRDLATFDRIWLIWWFNKNKTWRPLVLPPRGAAKRRGVFATRSPHRPNPIGITAVPLKRIEGLKLIVGNVDLIDGTPILDIKPYIVGVDSFPDASPGWLGEIEATLNQPAKFRVVQSPLVTEQAEWLRQNFEVEFLGRAIELLERDPKPHRTRRISKSKGGNFRMGCGSWRLYFSVQEEAVLIERITPGYPMRLLKCPEFNEVPDREAQLAFEGRWPTVLY